MLRRLITVTAFAAGSLFAVGGASAVVDAVGPAIAAHASDGYCAHFGYGTGWTETDGTSLYTTDGDGWSGATQPWFGGDGNEIWYPIQNEPDLGEYLYQASDYVAQNQTPSGDPGYGFGPSQHWDICTDSDQIRFIDEATEQVAEIENVSDSRGEGLMGFYGDNGSPNFTSACSGEATIIYSSAYTPGNINSAGDNAPGQSEYYADTSSTGPIAGLGLSQSTSLNASFYIYGNCGYPFP